MAHFRRFSKVLKLDQGLRQHSLPPLLPLVSRIEKNGTMTALQRDGDVPSRHETGCVLVTRAWPLSVHWPVWMNTSIPNSTTLYIPFHQIYNSTFGRWSVWCVTSSSSYGINRPLLSHSTKRPVQSPPQHQGQKANCSMSGPAPYYTALGMHVMSTPRPSLREKRANPK